MKRRSLHNLGITAIGVLSLLVLFSCNRHKQQGQAKPPEIPVVEIVRMDVPVYQDFVGQVHGEQDIAIRARVEGFLEGVHFQEGTRVSKGQLLYTIDPAPFKAKVAAQMSNVAEARTMLAKAESDLNRIKPLAESNAVSQSDLDAATAQYDAAKASLEAAKANLESAQIELSYTQIKSPINGIIGKTQAKVGDFVGRSPNPVVLNTVSNIQNVLVDFFLSESEYLTIAKDVISRRGSLKGADSSERAPLQMILADGSIFPETGHIKFIDREVDPSTGSILVQAEFPNPDHLIRPGQFARIRVKMDVIKDAMLIPKKAVSEVQGTYNVYVVSDSSKVLIRPVTVGTEYRDYDVVTSGLTGNERIVLEGLQMVRAGMPVSPVMKTYQSKAKNNE